MAKKRPNHPAQSNPHQQTPSSGNMMLRYEERRGPLPDPETLRQYDEVQPGFAERIVQRFEREAEHRHELERTILEADLKKQEADTIAFRHGQRFAFLIAIVGLLASGYCVSEAATTGQAWAGASIGGGSLAVLIGVFLYGRKARASDDEEQTTADKK